MSVMSRKKFYILLWFTWLGDTCEYIYEIKNTKRVFFVNKEYIYQCQKKYDGTTNFTTEKKNDRYMNMAIVYLQFNISENEN